ncbi:MAG: TonB family protein [Opitutaceae bacterium]|nr:TonB family protein [Opitutaceae bacterium]
MITKIALLSRILPSLFRRLPAVTSVGYLMPHKTSFFAGIAGSAVLHATVLFAFNTPRVPPPSEALPTDLGGLPEGWAEVVVEEEPVKPEPTLEEGKREENTETAGADETPAHFAEPIANPFDGDITIKAEKVVLKFPDPNKKSWEVPRKPVVSGRRTTGVIFNQRDLDRVPVAANRVNPRYPFELKRQGLAGKVVLRFVVDSRGDVSDVEVVSANYPEFGVSAAEALLKWKFKAGMKDGNRVNTRMEIPMNFAVERDT